jgi:subfamily B ATP-binding cassette protein MsbA
VAVMFYIFAVKIGASPAQFIQFVLAIFAMYRPLKNVIRLNSNLHMARSASERVFELLATKPTVVEPAHPKPLNAAGADIHFEHISFFYDEKPVLRGIDLTIKAGQMCALVGQTGSGKTTITNLLLRFYDPQKGRVRIGERDVREVSLKDLRSQMAIVSQDPILFNDTIRNNIALGRAGASEQEIQDAARHAFAHDFIMEKPGGYDFVVGEKGTLLSGGQKQRLTIARAILRNAPILILDEATNSLDTEVERAVQAALEELMKGRTTICIAHRLSTIQRSDVIVVLQQGQIMEKGTHEELLQRAGLYKKLHDLQFQ